MDFATKARTNILDHLGGEVSTKEISQKESRQIHALVGVCVTVIVLNARCINPENLTCHVAKETRLFVFLVMLTDVRKEFFCEYIGNIERTMRTRGPTLNM